MSRSTRAFFHMGGGDYGTPKNGPCSRTKDCRIPVTIVDVLVVQRIPAPSRSVQSIDEVDRKYSFHAFQSNGESRGEQAEKKNTGKNGRNSSGTLPEKSSEKVLSSVTKTRNNSKEQIKTFWRCQNSLSSGGFPLIKHIAISYKNECRGDQRKQIVSIGYVGSSRMTREIYVHAAQRSQSQAGA